jgi:small subunit ribosomal protein S1
LYQWQIIINKGKAMTKKDDHELTAEVPPDESWWAAILADAEAQKECDEILLDPTAKQQTQPIDWDWAKQLYKKDEIITLKVTGYNRGGVLVEDERIQGFVPISHLVEISEETSDESRDEILDTYVGRDLRLKVIECSPKRERVVLSERAALAAPGRRLELLGTLEVGERAKGRVTTVTDFGVFVDLGGVEGLIHISELSWGRVSHPSEVLSPGEQVEVHILNLDQQRCRVALSLKRLLPNPWDTAHLHYQPGQVADAIITNIVPYGAFARLEEGLDGLIHISEIEGNPQKPEEILTEGQHVKVSILHIDTDRQQLGLRLQAIEGDEM